MCYMILNRVVYDIENRKELIGDDNSLKRKKRAICKFLKPKKPIKIIAEKNFDRLKQLEGKSGQFIIEGRLYWSNFRGYFLRNYKYPDEGDIFLSQLFENYHNLVGEKIKIIIEKVEDDNNG